MSFFNDKLIASVAWYDLTKTHIPTPDLANPDFVTVIGQARSMGWEFALQGQVAPGWNVIGNLALTHATVTQSTDSNNPVGAPLGNVPEVLLNLWTTYEWQEGALKGLKVGGGMTYSSPVPYLNGGNSGLYTDPYTIFSAMASYSFNFHGVKWTAQINGYNLLNLKYLQEVQAGGNFTVLSSPPNVTYTANNVVWGMPRTILASLKAEF
jgi:iron complex outermembrane receptor protein